jgi:hypothetical protein
MTRNSHFLHTQCWPCMASLHDFSIQILYWYARRPWLSFCASSCYICRDLGVLSHDGSKQLEHSSVPRPGLLRRGEVLPRFACVSVSRCSTMPVCGSMNGSCGTKLAQRRTLLSNAQGASTRPFSTAS